MKTEESENKEVVDAPQLDIVEAIDQPGQVELIQQNMRAEVLKSDRRYFYAQHIASQVLSQELDEKLDKYFSSSEEITFSEDEEKQITEACEKIFDFFDQYFSDEYFEEMAKYRTEPPQVPEEEINCRFSLRTTVEEILTELADIKDGVELVSTAEESEISTLCQDAISQARSILDQFPNNPDISSVDDQSTIFNGRKADTLSLLTTALTTQIADIKSRLAKNKSDLEYLRETSAKLEELKTQRDELNNRKGRARKFIHSIAPSTISANERKMSSQIDNLSLAIKTKRERTGSVDLESLLKIQIGKVLNQIQNLKSQLEFQATNPPKDAESDELWSGLAMVHSTDRSIELKDGEPVLRSLGHEPYNLYQRYTVHFTLNQVVFSHLEGNWDSKKYVVISPARNLVASNGEPDAVGQDDTWFSGDVTIPDGSVIYAQAGSSPLNLGADKLKGIKIISCDNPIEVSRDALLGMDYKLPVGGDIEPLRRLEEGGYRLALSEEHYDSVQMNLERQASKFMMSAITGDKESAIDSKRRFDEWFLNELPKLPERTATLMRSNLAPVIHAMESYLAEQGNSVVHN